MHPISWLAHVKNDSAILLAGTQAVLLSWWLLLLLLTEPSDACFVLRRWQHMGMRVILVNSQSVPIPQKFRKFGAVY